MRKPRDFDAEIKVLQDRQKSVRADKVTFLGELVLATGANALDPETLAGALLDAVHRAGAHDGPPPAWCQSGEAFFRRQQRRRPPNGHARGAAPPPAADHGGAAPDGGAAAPR